MFGRMMFSIAGKVLARPVRRKIRAFEQATHEPEARQKRLLDTILAYHADTDFARDHGFSSIRTIADYRRQVPFAPYERFAPYIDEVRKGNTRALLADPKVLMFALTSGTTASRKHIPITQNYLDDYKRGWNIWGLTAMSDHRQIAMKPMMQLAGDPDEYRTPADVPCGNLSGLTVEMQKKVVRWLYSVPSKACRIKDTPTRYYVAVLFSLRRRVGMLLSANPSTLVGIARTLDQYKEGLLRDLRDGTIDAKLDIPADLRLALESKLKPNPKRAAELEAAMRARGGALLPMDVWPPETLLLGCWTGGSVGPYLRQLPQYYGDAPIRDLGLLASEGRMTIPLSDNTPSGVLDISSHFFDFIPEAEIDSPHPTVLGAHEVEEGKSYFILPTTKAGLYRYHIVDLVRVTGFYNRTPLIEFLGKGNRFTNLTGEKLSEHHVTQAMIDALRSISQPLTAYALAPCWDEVQPFYGIFLEEPDVANRARVLDFAAKLDAVLATKNSEYESKRDSGRLGALRVFSIPAGGWIAWDRARLATNGGSPEQYKHPCLINDMELRKTLGATQVG